MKYPYVTVALIVLFGAIDIGILGNQYGLDATTWPGWVQAIGSISALAVAIFVMSRQNRHAARLLIETDKRTQVRRARAVSAIVDRAHAQILQLIQKIEGAMSNGDALLVRSAFGTAKIVLLESQVALRSIPAHELGSYEMVIGIQKTIDILITFDKVFGIWLGWVTLPQQAEIAELLNDAMHDCRASSEIFRRGIAALITD